MQMKEQKLTDEEKEFLKKVFGEILFLNLTHSAILSHLEGVE